MAMQTNTEKKAKRPRGSNWTQDGLKALLQNATVKRVKIRGSEAVGEARDTAWDEIADAVSATGSPKTAHECFTKLRCYTSEVKTKFLFISRETINKSGGAGGTPVKEMQPTELEEMALAFLGVEKISGIIGGRKTSLKPDSKFDYVEERKRERKVGEDLERRFSNVTKAAKKAARCKPDEDSEGGSSDDDDDDDDDFGNDSLFGGSSTSSRRDKTKGKSTKKKGTAGKQDSTAGVMNRMAATIDRIEERLIRIETKDDEMSDAITELRVEIKARTPAAAAQGSNDINDEEHGTKVTKKKPKPAVIPFLEVRLAFEEFFSDANEDEWTLMMMAAVGATKPKRDVRERVYLKVLQNWAEDDIDDLQAYFINNFPQFIKERIQDKSHYHILTAVGCDLVAYGKFDKFIKNEEIVQAAIGCRVLHSAPPGKEAGCGDASTHNGNLDNGCDMTTPPTSGNVTPEKTPQEKSKPTPGTSTATEGDNTKGKSSDKSDKATPKKRPKAGGRSTGTPNKEADEPDFAAPSPKRVRRSRAAKKD